MSTPVRALCESEPATIASGASLSGGVNLGGRILTGFYMPAGWTAASITFQASEDGAAWSDVHVAAGELSAAVAAGLYEALDPMPFYGVKWLRLRSGTSASPVNQSAARAFTLMLGQPSL